MNFHKTLVYQLISASLLAFQTLASATGVVPDTPLLVISEDTGTAQMGVKNTQDEPLLLLTTIVDIPEDKGATVFALPAVTRIEGNKRQVIRFVLDKSDAPLKVQHLKRVTFEGIPTARPEGESSSVKIIIRQDLPVVISPAGLKQDPEPWKNLNLKWADGKLTLSNPSAYVIRLSQIVSVTPDAPALKILPRPFVLPGESFSVDIPTGVPDGIKTLQIFPASPYGFDVPPFDAPLTR